MKTNRSMLNIGVDIGGTTINIGVVNEKGEIKIKNTFKTETSKGSDGIISSLIKNIEIIIDKNKIDKADINSIGIGVPGTVNSQEGKVVFAPNIFWKDVMAAEPIKSALGIPVFLGQDSRASAWGEFLVGSGKGYNNMASITIGTGIGCGMIIGGQLFHGGLNTAGEFGHQLVVLDGHQCNCGKYGCLEAYSAGLAIVRYGKQIPTLENLLHKPIDEVAVKDVFDLAISGNSDALKITQTVVNYLGMGIVNLINLNSLELISISGGISNAPDELLFNPLKEFVKEHVYSAISDKVKLVKSSLGDNAPLIGAALLYKSN